MKKLFLLLSAFLLVMVGCKKDSVEELNLSHGDIISGSYIVVFNSDPFLKSADDGTYADRIALVENRTRELFMEKSISVDKINHIYGFAFKGFAADLTKAQYDKLSKDSRVKYIEPDIFVSLPTPIEEEDGIILKSTQTTPWGITRVGGAVNYTGTAKAWVIDTGIDLDHPDLVVDLSLSKTFMTNGPDSKSADDLNGHGSHVAGTIAAKNNDVGVVGVAAGATLVAVKVLDRRGSGTTSGVIKGVDYVGATAKAGDVANMSLGGGASSTLDDAVKKASDKGIWFSLAAGNDGKDANNYSPARVNGTYIYTISAMDNTDTFASFSNYGNPPIDYCAPGVSIYSCYKDGGYRTLSGTSMAAPHAAGVRLIGAPKTDGYVKNDKDSNPDPIIHW